MTTSRPPRITEEDINDGAIGAIFQHDDGSVWRLVSYCAQPTATLECIHGRPGCGIVLGPKPRLSGAVGAPVFSGLRKLVPLTDDYAESPE